MLLFAHTGLTLGAVKGISLARSASKRRGAVPAAPVADNGVVDAPPRNFIDYRLVLIGSMLPDIIDKPLGITLLGNGRAFGHMLLLNLVLVFIGIWLYYGRRRPGFLTLSLCSVGHLILDEMWRNPVSLFWPLYGDFVVTEERNIVEWLVEMVQGASTMSLYTIVAEVVGAVIVTLFVREKWGKRVY